MKQIRFIPLVILKMQRKNLHLRVNLDLKYYKDILLKGLLMSLFEQWLIVLYHEKLFMENFPFVVDFVLQNVRTDCSSRRRLRMQ